MSKNIIISSILHFFLIFITAISLPFLAKKPIDLPPIISVELIQIAENTNIPYAPKAKKIIEEVKKKEEKITSEQAPPKKVKKEKPDSVPLPDENLEKVKKIKEKNKILKKLRMKSSKSQNLRRMNCLTQTV